MPKTWINPGQVIKDRRGNITIIFGLVSLVAIAAVGGAVDIGRTYAKRSEMQNALDAAVVAGLTKYKSNQDWDSAISTAEDTFQAIFLNAMKQSQVTGGVSPSLEQPVMSFSQSNGTMTGSASITMSTPFVQLVMGDNMHVVSSSGGSLSNSQSSSTSGRKLEVSMMIDLTGSMGWSDAPGSAYSKKIDALQAAGKDLLDIILPTSGAHDN
ncbi:MAG: TadE/TadG family type IV pilus assembly protein, partial [Hyphomicrobiaceae bacterium]